MSVKSKYITPKFKKESNPKVGLLTLSTDLTIERDFYSICQKLPLDVFVNRIHNENPLTKENLLKMYGQLESITEKILPGEKINTVAYGCTSGTIAIGEDKVKEKIQLAKPGCHVTTPITSAIKAFNKMNVKKIAVFTPYPESVNKIISTMLLLPVTGVITAIIFLGERPDIKVYIGGLIILFGVGMILIEKKIKEKN